MLSAYDDNFTPFLPVWIPLFSFSCLIIVAKKEEEKSGGESGQPCLIPEFSWEGFQLFTVEYLAVGLS